MKKYIILFIPLIFSQCSFDNNEIGKYTSIEDSNVYIELDEDNIFFAHQYNGNWEGTYKLKKDNIILSYKFLGQAAKGILSNDTIWINNTIYVKDNNDKTEIIEPSAENNYESELEINTSENSTIRYDGYYYCEPQKGHYMYLKFYEDGLVLNVSTTGSINQISDWFNRQKYGSSKGNFEIENSTLKFTSISSSGSIEYNGQIISDSIINFNIKSNINGAVFNQIYQFVK